MAGIDFAPHNMTSNTSPSPYVASASGRYSVNFEPWRAFEANLSNNPYWISNTNTGWLKIYIGSTEELLNNYSVQVNTVPEPNRAPKAWTLQGSNDNLTWTILDTVAGQTSWGSGEIRNFKCDNPGSYKYFKIDVTENNGDSLLQIAELYLYKVAYANYLQERGRCRINLFPVSLGAQSQS